MVTLFEDLARINLQLGVNSDDNKVVLAMTKCKRMMMTGEKKE